MRKLQLAKPDLPPYNEIEDLFRGVFESGYLSNSGRYATQFEVEASAYLGTHVAIVSSATAGLILSLQALGLKPGQKVILPSFTFMATAQAVLYAGGIPVFAEIEDDLTLSASDLELQLNQHKDVAVVLPVHTYGLPCQVEAIKQVVEKAIRKYSRSIAILYDAAHAFGTSVKDQPVGTFGNAEVFSLSGTKILVSVEGGIVSSHDPDLILRIRRMRNYGIEENYDAYWPGLNGKMSELHAIVGLYNLRRIKTLLADRQLKARYYLEQIRKRTGFKTLPWPEEVIHTFKDFTVLVPETVATQRDAIRAFLAEQGIETRAYFYPPVHQQHFFRRFADRPLRRTEDLARRVIALPFYTTISTTDIDFVVDMLAEIETRLS
jgi:dTDP-4-amino-4,6-dideoxygalactose transaminase